MSRHLLPYLWIFIAFSFLSIVTMLAVRNSPDSLAAADAKCGRDGYIYLARDGVCVAGFRP